jgi:4-hydroxythreonine-4-phosphate dehydrogenase
MSTVARAAARRSRTKPIIGLLLGDPTGIGAEVTARVLAEKRTPETADVLLIGDVRQLQQGAADIGMTIPVRIVDPKSKIDFSSTGFPMIDLANMDPARIRRGEVSAEAGRLTGESLHYAIQLSERGLLDAITFAPLNKKALHSGGWRYLDEHKMFADLLKHQGYFSEMNVVEGQWMSRVTSHVSLRQALDLITPESITRAIHLVDSTMRKVGITNPRIAVCALNPHAGEGGLFGMEEIDFIAPTIKAVGATGINCTGPYPSDTIYLKAFAGEFDSVVAMYHDQGQIATKLKGLGKGVTITAGLDTVFTTPAHGTAFDIVGKGIATPGALQAALALAARLTV